MVKILRHNFVQRLAAKESPVSCHTPNEKNMQDEYLHSGKYLLALCPVSHSYSFILQLVNVSVVSKTSEMFKQSSNPEL